MALSTVAITPGSGANIVTDHIGSNDLQVFKASWGAAGTQNLADVPTPVPVQGTVEASQMSAAGTIVTPLFAVINVSSSGDNSVVAAVTGKKIRVLAYTLVCDAAVAVKFTDGASGTAKTGAMSFAANGGSTPPFCPVGHLETSANTALVLNLASAVGVRGHLTYITV